MRLAAALAAAAVVSSAALAEGRLSPPLSVEGARAALAQAGVREGSPFGIGPYRWVLVRAAPTRRGANRFTIDVVVRPLPMQQ